MILNPAATAVLCFGDSNTYGIDGDDPDYGRLPADIRWTGQLQRMLGDDYYVIEEGLSGRTVDLDYPDRPGLNGRAYLTPCLLSHAPDVTVLMLGTNDLKAEFDRSAADIAAALAHLLDGLADNPWLADVGLPQVILVSPAQIDESAPRLVDESPSFSPARAAEGRKLASHYRAIAVKRGLAFVDAAECARVGSDGIHLTADAHGRLAQVLANTLLARR